MKTIKHSRQRDSILKFLEGRKDHPTADTVYRHIRAEYPNISLGTVYRNLSLLSELGEITKLSYGTGPDHFDGNTAPHYHFICTECDSVSDIEFRGLPDLLTLTDSSRFAGEIEGCCLHFFGRCPECCRRTTKDNLQ